MDEARKQLSHLASLTGDVNLVGLVDNANFRYDSTSGKWINASNLLAVVKQGGGGTETFTGGGAIASVDIRAETGVTANVDCTGVGAVAIGSVYAETYDAYIGATGRGSVAMGYSNDNDIFVPGDGSFGGGYACSDGIQAKGNGCFAFGFGTLLAGDSSSVSGAVALGNAGSQDIKATADGAIAMGNGTSAPVLASAAGAVQVASGTNFQPDSLQVGSGVRLCSAAPTTQLKNGDIWVDGSGRVCIRSAGVTHYLPATSIWSH